MRPVVLVRYALGIVLPLTFFAIIAANLDDAIEIQILNLVRLSLSTGVLVAYLPPVFKILNDPRPLQRSDYLSFGIVWSWLAVVCSGFWWVVFHITGRADAMLNNDFVALTIFLSCLGATFHLAAPGAIENRIPPVRWVKIGLLAATGLFVALLILNAANIRIRIDEVLPHDRSNGP